MKFILMAVVISSYLVLSSANAHANAANHTWGAGANPASNSSNFSVGNSATGQTTICPYANKSTALTDDTKFRPANKGNTPAGDANGVNG